MGGCAAVEAHGAQAARVRAQVVSMDWLALMNQSLVEGAQRTARSVVWKRARAGVLKRAARRRRACARAGGEHGPACLHEQSAFVERFSITRSTCDLTPSSRPQVGVAAER